MEAQAESPPAERASGEILARKAAGTADGERPWIEAPTCLRKMRLRPPDFYGYHPSVRAGATRPSGARADVPTGTAKTVV